MIKRTYIYFSFILCLLVSYQGVAQHINDIKAILDPVSKSIKVKQKFIYKNNSNDTLQQLYFNDWANAYANKNTALAKRFAEEFKKSLHLAKDHERGKTEIVSIVSSSREGLEWERTEASDILRVDLDYPLLPHSSVSLYFTYQVKLPPKKYTPYGYTNRSDYYLKDWYITPAVYNGKWQLYSNKNLEDLYTGITQTSIDFSFPKDLFLASNFYTLKEHQYPHSQKVILLGEKQKSGELIISPVNNFTQHKIGNLLISTDINPPRYDPISQAISIERLGNYITENLGEFPHQQLLVSEIDYDKNPLYGINQLPSFIRPYEEQFQFELKFLKTALNSYLRESLFLNPRKDKWVTDAIVNYLMIKYVDTYYPKAKLLGKLSKIWGVRSFHLAKMDFNDQYPFLYMFSARKNLNQSLITPNDSLIKFNQKISNRYKAGLGLAYLADYLGAEVVDNSIKDFYKEYQLKPVQPVHFRSVVESKTEENLDWFFKEYVSTDQNIDYTISKVKKDTDSVQVTIKNKLGTTVPISLFGITNDSVVSKIWFTDIQTDSTVTIPRNNAERLVLNYDQKIPEFNQRNNWKTLNGFFSSNKKLKFQFFKDAENPYYNQVFYVPTLTFNIYDGITPGLRLHNKTLLERPFIFDISPSYSFSEQSFVGGGGISYRKYHGKSGLYVSSYGLGGSTYHYATNSRYTKITPSFALGWRPDDLIANNRKFFNLRYVAVNRDQDPLVPLELEEPNYNILNARFISTNRGILNYVSWFADTQFSNNFTKVAFNLEYRKLFENNRQLNVRFFAGKFLRNKTGSDFYSFALDKPTDYLFDYAYLGRSESSGLASQQIIIAEGGFKSKLEDPYSNNWMTTVNTSFNVWRWIELYGDAGLLQRKNANTRFVYDSGVRLNLVTDYFELYFPLYSNNGWEVAQPNYNEKIRFIVTLSPKTLLGLFTRKWF